MDVTLRARPRARVCAAISHISISRARDGVLAASL